MLLFLPAGTFSAPRSFRFCGYAFIISVLACIVMFFEACTYPAAPIRPNDRLDSPNPKPAERTEAVSAVAPWQLWRPEPEENPLGRGDVLESQGRLNEALKAYRDAELAAQPGRTREEAFVRGVGVMLKLGQSRAALDEITRHLKINNLTNDDISPILALLAAYAYLDLGDVDQSLAWFGVVRKRSNPQSIVASRARAETERLIKSISVQNFEKEAQLWSTDKTLAPLFEEEKQRRAGGGTVQDGAYAKWFEPATYGVVPGAALKETDLNPSASSGPITSWRVIGVLLPESGKYAEHSARVRRGIELAYQDAGSPADIQLAFADTSGDPAQAVSEYERLIRDQHAALVLGPLLVKTSEEVAKRSNDLGVPFLTFTKRPGITALSKVGFRLGATSENQASELASYSTRQLGMKKFATLIPQDGGNGEEFAGAFRAEVRRVGAKLSAESAYAPGNAASIEAAIKSISDAAPDTEAIFIPESLESALPVVQAVRNSPLQKAVLLGPATWNDTVAVRGYGSLLEGAVVVTPFFAGSAQPQVAEFISHYRQSYNSEPELLAAQGYDAARLALFALGNNQPDAPDFRENIIRTLRSADSTIGATGKLSVGKNGDISRRMSVLRVSGGELLEVMSGGNVTGFIPDDPQGKEAPQT